MSNASRVATIVSAARGEDRTVQVIDPADALDAATGIVIAADGVSYPHGVEVVLNVSATRAASAGGSAGTPIDLGTLVAPLRPSVDTFSRGSVETSPNVFVTGSYRVTTAGLISFIPDGTITAGAGFVFRLRPLRIGPPAAMLSTFA